MTLSKLTTIKHIKYKQTKLKILKNQAKNVCLLASKNLDNEHLVKMCIEKSCEAFQFEDEQSY